MYLLSSFLLVASAIVRALSLSVITSDYTYFLAKWFDALKNAPHLSAFAQPFADYAPLYLYLLKLLTFLPIPSLYSIKGLSIVFDICIGIFACMTLYYAGVKKRSRLFLSFAVLFALPTLVLNSSLWGQSDSSYAALVMLSFACIVADRPLGAAWAFAAAFCIKFQVIFFLPILVGYLLRRQESVLYLLLIPFAFVISVIPAWLGGGSFSYWLFVYAKESGEYTGLSISAQNIFAFVHTLSLSGQIQTLLFWAGLIAAVGVALAVLILMARAGLSKPERVLLLSLVCVSILPYVLPRMHERYFYLADIFSALYALYVPRHWYIPVLVVGASLLSYLPYLSQVPALAPFSTFDLRIPSAMMFIALLLMVAKLVRMPEVSLPPAIFREP